MNRRSGEDNRRQGIKAERIAERHLRSIGYRLLCRNLIVGGSEIDLLMKDRRTRELIVIEVKSSRLGEHQAMAALNARKRSRIARAVRGLQRLGLDDEQGIRVEAILIDLSGRRPDIRHLR
jgi:putative endonuclease